MNIWFECCLTRLSTCEARPRLLLAKEVTPSRVESGRKQILRYREGNPGSALMIYESCSKLRSRAGKRPGARTSAQLFSQSAR